jgi:hypothetical protein
VGKPVPISRRLCQGIGEGAFCRYVKDVALNDRGRFAVVWEIAGSPTVFYAQAYSPNVVAGANSVELGFQGNTSPNPAIALANDGTVAVALRHDTGIPEDAGLFLQRFRAP